MKLFLCLLFSIAVFSQNKEELNLATNNGSLYFCCSTDKQSFVFASERHILNILIDDFSEHLVKTVENALSKMMDEERKKSIQDCLNLLPSEEGFLLTLFYFEDQSLEEIAKIMDITANNAKVKLYRSRQKLTSILKEKLCQDPKEMIILSIKPLQ